VNKAIILAVIAVGITAIAFSSFGLDDMNINMKISDAEPLEPLHVEGMTRDNGEIVCPDGETKETSKIFSSLVFSKDLLGNKGTFSMATQDNDSQRRIFASLYNGNVTSSDYHVYGVAQINEQLHKQCNFAGFQYLMEITVWGLCGEEETINFETNSGYKGNSIGTVICI